MNCWKSEYDVAIIGGGPGGSTVAALLRKFCPQLSVVLFERERFPRDHVGESLLPVTCKILDRMGCWDKVEAAMFPVKVGATYRWGSSDDLWDFDFLSGETYEDAPRPATYDGQRQKSAFQVDRSIFDTILLEHAESLGVEVHQGIRVSEVVVAGQAVERLRLEDGTEIKAKYTIDASGSSAILRRALGVEVTEPSNLKNIAIWRYWNNADWAVTIGATGTRVQVLSLGWGWIWVIPITTTRTSVGLVVPTEYFKKTAKRPAELYEGALNKEPNARLLLEKATVEEEVYTTKDWSFVASRMVGENWFLVGESAGFADPILSAGVTLTMVGAQEAAITIAELERGRLDPAWLKSEFDANQQRNIKTHIQFADYWYTANSHFTDLVEFTGQIANESGLRLKGSDAWQWLGTGGFVQKGGTGIGGFSLSGTDWLVRAFEEQAPEWRVATNNLFSLNLEGAAKVDIAIYHEGYVEKVSGIERGNRTLPARGVYRFLVQALTQTQRLDMLMPKFQEWCQGPESGGTGLAGLIEALEAMINDGWVHASYDSGMNLLDLKGMRSLKYFHKNTDNEVGF